MKKNDLKNLANIESEVKFLMTDLHRLEEKLQTAGAIMDHARVLETNLRFDTPDGTLTSRNQVLRLRKDQRVRLTYKGPANPAASIAQRTELLGRGVPLREKERTASMRTFTRSPGW